MRKFWKKSWKDEMSLCQAFWLTTFAIATSLVFAFMALGLVFLVSLIVYITLIEGLNLQFKMPSLENALIFSCLLGPIMAMMVLAYGADKDGRRKQISGYIALSLFALSLVVIPIYLGGIVPYSIFIVKLTGLTALAASALFIAIKTFTRVASSDNLLTRFFKALTDNFCPTLSAEASQ